MKRKLAYIFALPLLFSVLAFQGNCHSQCQELRQEIIKDCRDDLGPNSERCREDQKKFQEICHDESQTDWNSRKNRSWGASLRIFSLPKWVPPFQPDKPRYSD